MKGDPFFGRGLRRNIAVVKYYLKHISICIILKSTYVSAKPNPDAVLVNCQYSMAVFSTGERKRRPRGDRRSQEMSIHLRQTFEAAIKTELYPRSQIDIFVEVLQGD